MAQMQLTYCEKCRMPIFWVHTGTGMKVSVNRSEFKGFGFIVENGVLKAVADPEKRKQEELYTLHRMECVGEKPIARYGR